MADLSFKIKGDASEAKEAMHEAGLSAEQLKENVKELGLEFFAFEKAKEMVVDFAKESVQAFSEMQKAQLQLKAVAGEMTEEFVKQGEEFEKHYAISLKTIEGLQTLMLRFDAAPEAIKPATQAILDYAAATGHDAEGATQALMRAVERGANGVKSLGIVYESTGDKTKDLALATAELEKKYGGAAETERGGLSGSLRAVALAQEHVHEAFGGMLNTLEQKTGALDKVASVFERIAAALGSMSIYLDSKGFAKFTAMLGGFAGGGVLGAAGALALSGGDEEEGPSAEGMSSLGAPIHLLGGAAGKGSFTDTVKAGKAARDTGGKDLKSAFGEFEGADKELERSEKMKMAQLEDEIALAKHFAKMQEEMKAQDLFEDKEAADDLKRKDAWLGEAQKLYLRAEEDQQKEDQRLQKLANEAMAKATKDAQHEQEAEMKMWQSIGEKTGQLFIDAIGKTLNDAISGNGKSSSFQSILGGLVQGVLSIVFGAVLGPMGSKAIADTKIGTTISGEYDEPGRGSASDLSGGQTSHDGSWIERFHSGGWPRGGRDEVPAVLQTGERVLSRAEVGRMGGRAGVDAAAGGRGGGGMSVTVQAFDTVGVRDFFADRGGRGLVNALRVGRGDIVPLLGRG